MQTWCPHPHIDQKPKEDYPFTYIVHTHYIQTGRSYILSIGQIGIKQWYFQRGHNVTSLCLILYQWVDFAINDAKCCNALLLWSMVLLGVPAGYLTAFQLPHSHRNWYPLLFMASIYTLVRQQSVMFVQCPVSPESRVNESGNTTVALPLATIIWWISL